MNQVLNIKVSTLLDWQVEELEYERREKELIREIAEEEMELKKCREYVSMRAMKRYNPRKYYDLYHVCVD